MPTLIPSNRAGPTGTKTLAKNYRRHLQRPLNQLITDVRAGIIEEDVFGLRVTPDTLASDDLPPLVRHDRRETKEDRFNEWLNQRLGLVLEQVQIDGNPYVRSAYARGIKDANRMVRAQGGDAPAVDMQAVFNLPIHQRALSRLFREDYTDLEDITRELSNQINEELTEALAQGENPRKVARRITDRIDKVGKTRAETLARTRLVAAHSEASLNRYEELSVDTVRHGEWETADDDRVCVICRKLEGREIPLGEARSGTFEVTEDELPDDEKHRAGTFPLRPPAHPRGRCVLIPVIGGGVSTSPSRPDEGEEQPQRTPTTRDTNRVNALTPESEYDNSEWSDLSESAFFEDEAREYLENNTEVQEVELESSAFTFEHGALREFGNEVLRLDEADLLDGVRKLKVTTGQRHNGLYLRRGSSSEPDNTLLVDADLIINSFNRENIGQTAGKRTLRHELGHHRQAMAYDAVERGTIPYDDDVSTINGVDESTLQEEVSGYAAKNSGEAAAEMFRMLAENPDKTFSPEIAELYEILMGGGE